MAGKRPTARAKRYSWVGHIQVYFNDDERQEVIKYLDERPADLENTIAIITQTDTSVKVTYDGHNDCYQGTLQPKGKSDPYTGYTIGFSHTDLKRLIPIMGYIRFELMEHNTLDKPDKRNTADW